MTREEWLEQAVAELKPMIVQGGGNEFTRTVRISVSFPSRSIRKRIGECWHCEASADGSNQLFISPTLDDGMTVLGVVAHELIHASDNGASKHSGYFVKVMKAIGLEGKPTATVPGETFTRLVAPLLKQLGPYPHSALNLSMNATKKQTTRMLKVVCECEAHEEPYILRASRKTLDAGMPICPAGETMQES